MQRDMAEPAALTLTLLDIAARAPAAAARIAGALGEEDRKAFRLAHPALRDAVAEVVLKIVATFGDASDGAARPARPPTARRWHALRELELIAGPALMMDCLRALGAEAWPRLEQLCVNYKAAGEEFGLPVARALAVAAPRLPALRDLDLRGSVSAAALSEIFGAEWRALGRLFVDEFKDPAGAGAAVPPAPAPAARNRLSSVTLHSSANSEEETARWLAAQGWPLEDLNIDLTAASLATLVAAPTFALRELVAWMQDAAALRALADAPWPLESLELTIFPTGHVDGPSAAALRALVSAAWPELTHFAATMHILSPDFGADPDEEALGAAAFALCPNLKTLCLHGAPVGAAGARALASRRWARLQGLSLNNAQLDDAALTALARGAWPALERLDLSENPGIGAPPTLADVQQWAPEVTKFEV